MTRAIVIFGGTGDLSRRKLYPALYNLFARGRLTDTVILACGRKPLRAEEFRSIAGSFIQKLPMPDAPLPADFLPTIHYHSMDFRKAENFKGLYRHLVELAPGTREKVLGLLAVPAAEYEPLVKNGLKAFNASQRSRIRLLVEKPIGRDYSSAKKLNRLFKKFVGEENTFRTDHFLAKEVVENLMVVRFSNRIFESVWNRDFIDSVQISFSEKIGVENRAAFYEQTGALRDYVQSHLLQVLALVAMEEPADLSPDTLTTAKVKVLRRLAPLHAENVVFGQYAAGTIDKQAVPAYASEPGISPESRTETFVALKTFVRNKRWAGVPFYLRTGKRLDRNEGLISIIFKPPHDCPFSPKEMPRAPNVLKLQVQPEEMFRLSFNLKTPEEKMAIKPVSMDYCYSCDYLYQRMPYEKILEDAMAGDHTRFSRNDEVELAWKWVETLKAPPPPHPYPAGSKGPAAAEHLVKKDGFHWLEA
ncbi:MAG: glucose-6-phosphate dehydrogenase [Candidatus Micrarchaeota archaeon]|nr:glucose-6-phosphate dehydrogenase [Candidatus Micrarchaeota archaeon]